VLQRLQVGEIPVTIDPATVTSRNGKNTPVEAKAAPLRDSAGGVHGIVMVLRDKTERERAEQALREAERRFRAMFESALDAILIADDDAHYLAANPAACALLGLSQEELLQHRVVDFMELEDFG
jgi:PAS domain-containing protein